MTIIKKWLKWEKFIKFMPAQPNKNIALKSFVKQVPWLHQSLRFFYWQGRSLRDRFLGTTAQERYWRNRHRHKNDDWNDTSQFWHNRDWAKSYWSSISHPHRQFLLKHINRLAPFNNLLEIGANCGPNLYILAKKFPQSAFRGIDINPAAVEFGQKHFEKLGIHNVNLEVGRADQLDKFSDKSFDIIITDAVLIYIAPDKIKRVIQDMIRVSRKALVFLEQHQEFLRKDNRGLGAYQFGLWQRNYRRLLGQFLPQEKIKLTKLPPKLWPDKNWSQAGYVIKAFL